MTLLQSGEAFKEQTPTDSKNHEIRPNNKLKLSSQSVPHIGAMETMHEDVEELMNEEGEEPDNEEALAKNLASQTLPNSVWKRRSAAYSVSNPPTPTIPTRQGSSNRLRYFNPRYRDHMGNIQPQSLDNITDGDTNGSNNNRRYLSHDRKRSSFVNNFQELGSAFRMISRNRNSDSASHRERRTPHPVYAPDDQELRTKQLASDLIASLLAGGPASLFAGTNFLRDSHGKKRAPILLAMLDVKIRPLNDVTQFLNDQQNELNVENPPINLSRRQSIAGSIMSSKLLRGKKNNSDEADNYNKKTLFEISLEYGIDDYRSKWKVIKTYGSMEELHRKLKALRIQYTVKDLLNTERKANLLLPKFPRSKNKSKQYRNDNRKLLDSNASPRNSLVSSASSMSITSLNSELIFDVNKVHLRHLEDLINEQDDYNQPIQKRLERYFRLLNLALCLRPDANLLIQYYEFSTIGNLLSYEAGYKGKEGVLVNSTTAASQGWVIPYFTKGAVKEVVKRHTTKWCLVRDSYITYVSDIFSTTPLEVFMVDSKFDYSFSGDESHGKGKIKSNNEDDDIEWDLEDVKKISTNLFITLTNSERKLTLLCKSEFSMRLWVASIAKMKKNCVWVGPKRFDSFAPVRNNIFAKYLVDGRDYFWSLSIALMKAEDVIYIHDWWLSPELYLRRPINGNQEYRIDRILKKKAEEGVKIFIIVYRNVGKTVGTDSLWTKHSFLTLHKNIHLVRSPNQWRQNIFFWAHHEKFTVIDNTIAFMGGIDLCFGRYDTPEHVLRDDDPDIKNQTFPGKDYSNARVSDFIDLDKPYKSMYDRKFVCRMPWHDVHTMIVGEPARDMARHFVQRWNYAIRRKRPSRPTPLLLPPVDFSQDELDNSPLFRSLKAKSTCEIQVLRSAGAWSLGLKETEQSIQNAYLKLIEQSEHYIYIENQFFVSTSTWDGIVIENRIGDAIVDRIIKAHVEKKTWKAFIIIPLMPGFDSPIDQPGASSLRVIVQCQYKSISRGPSSIFGKLHKLGINPHEYIHFFSLRKWSTFGENEILRTEQLYVHAKLLIVDDRSCIIGSANINERSQMGNRDSEIAAIIRDTATVNSKMNNKPYVAGKFPLELRQKLMREHMGCDVDLVDIVERKFERLTRLATLNYKTLNIVTEDGYPKKELRASAMIELAYREIFGCSCSPAWKDKYQNDESLEENDTFGIITKFDENSENDIFGSCVNEKNFGPPSNIPSINKYKRKKNHSFNFRAGVDNVGVKSGKEISKDPRLVNNHEHDKDVSGDGPDAWNKVTKNFKESVTKQLQEWATDLLTFKENFFQDKEDGEAENIFLPFKEDLLAYIESTSITNENKWDMLKRINYLQYLNCKEDKERDRKRDSAVNESSDIRSDTLSRASSKDKDDETIAVRLEHMLNKKIPVPALNKDGQSVKTILGLDFVDPYAFNDPICPEFFEDTWFCTAVKNTIIFRMVFHCQPDDSVTTWRAYKSFNTMYDAFENKQSGKKKHTKSATIKQSISNPQDNKVHPSTSINNTIEKSNTESSSEDREEVKQIGNGQVSKERNTFPSYHLNEHLPGYNDPIFDKKDALTLLKKVKGHLVLFATEWLSEELDSNNWFYNSDRMVPIEVYD